MLGERIMDSFLKRAALLLCLAVCGTAWGQSLPLSPGKTAPAPSTNSSSDPLNRDNPNGTLFGFLEAAQSRSFPTAAQYLQMPAAKRQTEGADLAMKLKVVMDVAFQGSLKKV